MTDDNDDVYESTDPAVASDLAEFADVFAPLRSLDAPDVWPAASSRPVGGGRFETSTGRRPWLVAGAVAVVAAGIGDADGGGDDAASTCASTASVIQSFRAAAGLGSDPSLTDAEVGDPALANAGDHDLVVRGIFLPPLSARGVGDPGVRVVFKFRDYLSVNLDEPPPFRNELYLTSVGAGPAPSAGAQSSDSMPGAALSGVSMIAFVDVVDGQWLVDGDNLWLSCDSDGVFTPVSSPGTELDGGQVAAAVDAGPQLLVEARPVTGHDRAITVDLPVGRYPDTRGYLLRLPVELGPTMRVLRVGQSIVVGNDRFTATIDDSCPFDNLSLTDRGLAWNASSPDSGPVGPGAVHRFCRGSTSMVIESAALLAVDLVDIIAYGSVTDGPSGVAIGFVDAMSIGSDLVYIGEPGAGVVTLVDLSMTEQWSTPVGDAVSVVAADDRTIVVADGPVLTALDRADGSVRWETSQFYRPTGVDLVAGVLHVVGVAGDPGPNGPEIRSTVLDRIGVDDGETIGPSIVIEGGPLGSVPLLSDDRVYVLVEQGASEGDGPSSARTGAAVVAIDRSTDAVLWRRDVGVVDGDAVRLMNQPLLLDDSGRDEPLFLVNTGSLVRLDPITGEERWRRDGVGLVDGFGPGVVTVEDGRAIDVETGAFVEGGA